MRELYEYQGRKIMMSEIARMAGCDIHTMQRFYALANNNIEAAIEMAKNRRRNTHEMVSYQGQRLSVQGVAKVAGVNDITLRKYYRQTGDIEAAVELARQNQFGKRQLISFKGQDLSMHALAQQENLSESTLSRYYQI